MRPYVRTQTGLLLARLAEEVEHAAREGDAEAIHDIRVALRRLSRCLRVFSRFYRPGAAKKIRRRIAALMACAGAVRDCDIAIELAAEAGVSRRNPALRLLAARRQKAGRKLLGEIRRWKRRQLVRQWRRRLEVSAT